MRKNDYSEYNRLFIDFFLEQMKNGQNNLGIPSIGFPYIKVSKEQDALEEFGKNEEFLKYVFSKEVIDKAPELFDHNMSLDFINYGDTQMVYVLTANGRQWSVLVTQPSEGVGVGKREFDNLRMLSTENEDVIVRPDYYFSDGEKELYVAPYIYQARCVASQDVGYGVYVPEPYYRFEPFLEFESNVVNTCMIANLIRLYDEERCQGIGACKIGGGDFILDKSWDNCDKSIESTLERMKLIAAREMIPMSLDDYSERILFEFTNKSYYSKIEHRDPKFLINHKNRVPMNLDVVKDGIELGKQLRKKR